MKTLIIAEKPDMGRTIAAVVEPGAQNRRTYLEGRTYIITWAIGHLVGLAEPDRYDARYKRWNDADLPIIPESFKLWPNPRTKDQLKTIGELAKQCGAIINACDAGREGQLIFHLIRKYLKLRHPVQRLWISDLTPETIRRGFETLRSEAEYEPLTRAAVARSEADWLIGMNASRAFTIRHRALLSVGRVQTPVLAIIYDRHREIESFRPETYYTVRGAFRAGDVDYSGVRQGERITAREQADEIAAKVDGKPGAIVSCEAEERKEYPFRLHDLTLLQREANGRYGFSAKKTLDLAQSLYEKHKVITYPRTNSNYVTKENVPAMHKTLAMLQNGSAYIELANKADRGRVHTRNRAVCNPAKVEDHHAILPTAKRPTGLTPDEHKIYDMVVRRFLSHFFPPAVYKHHEVLTEVEGETFRTKVKEQLDPGWKIVQESGAEDKQPKGRRKKGDEREEQDEELLVAGGGFAINPQAAVRCTAAEVREQTTQPPKAYTEGTLLKAMESAGRAIEDDELREAMKETGLGTPATRAATIERLKQVGYIELSGKRLDITAKGRAAVELIRGAGVELLASPEMTGRWEQRLHQISRGEASDERFMEQVKKFAAAIVDKVREQPPSTADVFREEREQRRAGKTAGKGRRGTGRRRAVPGAAADGGAGTSGATAGAAGGRGKRAAASARRTGRAAPAASGGAPDDAMLREAAAAAGLRTAVRSPQAGAGASGAGLAACPRPGCGGRLIEGKRGFGCTRYRDGCTFVIWKDYRDKTISASMAAALAEKGATRKLTFKRADGTSAKGKLVLADRSTGMLRTVLE